MYRAFFVQHWQASLGLLCTIAFEQRNGSHYNYRSLQEDNVLDGQGAPLVEEAAELGRLQHGELRPTTVFLTAWSRIRWEIDSVSPSVNYLGKKEARAVGSTNIPRSSDCRSEATRRALRIFHFSSLFSSIQQQC